MKTLWHQRQQRHLTQQLKYLRLVFNDHFMIALIFLFGALGVSYANALKGITTLWWGKPVLILAFWALLQVGQFASLIFEADSVFLQPREADMREYLRGAWRYSLPVPLTALLFVGLLAFPFAVRGAGVTTLQWAAFLLILVLLKSTDLVRQGLGLLMDQQTAARGRFWLAQGISVLSLALSVYGPSWLAIVAILAAIGWYMWLTTTFQRVIRRSRIDWLVAIGREERRQFRIYRFYNLFTDVPGLTSSAKRRKYLDVFIPRLTLTPPHTFTYLYVRGFFRGSEYLGLFLRLTIIGAIALYFIPTWWAAALVAALFIYLIGFQLLPFAGQYSNNVMTFLYPVPPASQQHSFARLLTVLLLLAWVIFVIPMVWQLGFSLLTLAAAAIALAVTLAFIYLYAPRRIAKMQ
ncbi:ABC transporter permease [Schleiferilactobacillus harbinensis]|uniref:ABC transporter permease n=1 Tax=Schleiferilactobacillus harbinensis TaxID=304207 RepID=UPI00116EAA04|nr:ABC transporter permease [Schleiferilactobacillus harbinensis]GEK05336.1 multidrug ABC transporter permease [Schleiferilactobacillus harbinensis]